MLSKSPWYEPSPGTQREVPFAAIISGCPCHLDVGLAGGDLGGQGALHVAEELDAGGGGAPNILVITDLRQRGYRRT